MFKARLADIVAALGGELVGDGERGIERIGKLDDAGPETLTFLASARYRTALAQSRAGAVILAPAEKASAPVGATLILTADPYLYFARLTQWWARQTRPVTPAGVHASAVVDASAQLGEGVSIGPFAVVEADARIGDGAVIGAHAFVGRGARIGALTRLEPRVTFGYGCRIGARGILYSGAVIGADGFGHAPGPDRQWVKIEQLGAVTIGDDVEIGANTCVDRGALDDTLIEDGVKLDNQIQIAHNVVVGAHTAMAGCVGVAGSTRIGRHCTFGGSAMILGHLTLADGVHISAGTLISRSILQPGQYTGVFPFDDNAAWEKNAATLRQLYSLRQRLRDLEKKAR